MPLLKKVINVDRKNALSVLWVTTLTMSVSFTVWVSISTLAADIGKIYELTASEKSVLVAVPILIGSLLRLPIGIATEKYGSRKSFTFLMLFLLLPLIGLGFADTFSEFLIWGSLLGTAGGAFTIGIMNLAKWFPAERQGLVLGIVGMGNFGTAVAGFYMPVVFQRYNLQWTFWSLLLPVVLSALFIWLFAKDPPQQQKGLSIKNQRRVLKHKTVWILSLFYFVSFGGFVAFNVYLPGLLTDLFAYTPAEAGVRAVIFGVLATLTRPYGGYLADKTEPKRILSVVFMLIAASASMLGMGLNNHFVMDIACLVAGIVIGIGNGAIFKLVPQLFPNHLGITTGIIGTFGGIGGLLPPFIMSSVKHASGGYDLGILFLITFALICAVLVGLIQNGPTEDTAKPANDCKETNFPSQSNLLIYSDHRLRD